MSIVANGGQGAAVHGTTAGGCLRRAVPGWGRVHMLSPDAPREPREAGRPLGLTLPALLPLPARRVSARAAQDPQRMLEVTGLYGVPTDATGKMVGAEGLVGSSKYREATGPVLLTRPQLERLQKGFDEGGKCYPGAR